MRWASEGSCVMGVLVCAARGSGRSSSHQEASVEVADTGESRRTSVILVPQDDCVCRNTGNLRTNRQVIIILPVRSAPRPHGKQIIAGRYGVR